MKIQIINPSKLKILLNLQDLEENNITLHSFLSGSENSKIFLKAIIEIAEEDLGIKSFDTNFCYETFCYDFSEFVIIVSLLRDNVSSNTSSFNFIGNQLSKGNLDRKNLLYHFFNMDDFLEFSDYIKNNIDFKIKSLLYKYGNIFFLELDMSNLSCKEFEKLSLILSETSNCVVLKNTNSFNIYKAVIAKFKEFGELLISDNALNL